ncbi:MAG: hypothetical protein KY462_13905 [Actinobacteria bacterium]|nr:hypothetical protein [Actinomycetota bacterium]
MSRRIVRLVAASVVVVAAIVGGHALVYTLGPTGHAHTNALAESGHASWPLPWLAAALFGVVGACGYGFARERRRGGSSWRGLWPQLASAQVVSFLLLEAGERAAAGIGTEQLLAEPVVLTGLVVQLAAALLATALLRTGERVAAWLGQPVPRVRLGIAVRVEAPVATVVPVRCRPDRVGLTRRGPPVRC